MKKFILSVMLAAAILPMNTEAQNKKKEPKMITTASGLQYTIYNPTKGVQAKKGDKVSVHYTGRLLNDTIFDSSIPRGQPITFKLGIGQVIPGWDEGIALLHKGEKALFIIPANLAYGDRAMSTIPANSVLKFEVELVDVIESVPLKPYDVKGLDTLTTASGLKYIMVTKNPAGAQAVAGKMVNVHYTGYLLDGKMFDSSVERGQPFQFNLGAGQVIKGWDEGIALLKTGEKARQIGRASCRERV